jgi:DnaJ-class molecular chaperone
MPPLHRSKTPLPHRLPGQASEHTTPMLPCDDVPIECPECSGDGVIVLATADGEVEFPCDCCAGTGTTSRTRYWAWLSLSAAR